AGYFNHAYGEVFRRPEPVLPEEGRFARVVGLDGEKMSKSNENGIWIFESGKPLAKRIGRIVTDSRAPAEPKDPEELLPFCFLELFLDSDELEDWRARTREGGEGAPGYGHMKARIVEAVEETFAPARVRREELLADPGEVDRILARGAEKARAIAVGVRDRALAACGLRNPLPR
ncbi:MAG: tryptophan--tRNA ligase, partial [Planctomycetota bacterium]|nr:tryptophan--tRNA ligase [Planctomycetota bacterium]